MLIAIADRPATSASIPRASARSTRPLPLGQQRLRIVVAGLRDALQLRLKGRGDDDAVDSEPEEQQWSWKSPD